MNAKKEEKVQNQNEETLDKAVVTNEVEELLNSEAETIEGGNDDNTKLDDLSGICSLISCQTNS